ncbi:unannotated protein [freshwater metagenome]|uniref:Unannotated protein n=1 Tax=freshwater metagenome TaxID=449393 RepID=A0A6J7F7M2_9ZZZZ|nr:hypothetical protein [Actinomycetota bacterium]
MYPQASAAPAAHDQALRESRRGVIEEHYAPIGSYDVEEQAAERWLYVAIDRGEHHTSTHATFEDLCEHAGGEVLDSGMGPIAAYDLDTGHPIELHVTTPVVTAAEDQGIAVHPDLGAVAA